MIVGPTGPVPVRPSTVDKQKFEFRNPLWEQELQRIAYVRSKEQEVRALQGDQEKARYQAQQALRAMTPFQAESPEQCKEPELEALPERPADAVIASEQAVTSSYVCAVAWRETLGNDGGTFYKLIDRNSVWIESGKESARQKRLNVHIAPPPLELQGLRLAIEQGDRSPYYDAAISRFASITRDCELKVTQATFLRSSKDRNGRSKNVRNWPIHISRLRNDSQLSSPRLSVPIQSWKRPGRTIQ
jgi:hypothetical protein